MSRNLKNYTTEVPAMRSIQNIDDLLVSFGARNIMREYSPTGKCESICFMLSIADQKLPFRIEGKVKAGYIWLKKKYPKAGDKVLLERSERMVWKQQHEWVHLQLTQIELGQLEVLEAFFPYLYNTSKRLTFYEQQKQNKFNNLLPAP